MGYSVWSVLVVAVVVIVELWTVEEGGVVVVRAEEVVLGESEVDFKAWVERVGERVRTQSSRDGLKKEESQALPIMQNGSNPLPESVIRVSKVGSGHTSVQSAINSVPSGNSKRVVIHIDAGVYEEKVRIPGNKDFITLEGDGAGSTIITGSETAATAGSLANSAIVGVDADYFIAKGITFKNTAPSPEGTNNRQGVALRISGDKAAFYSCSFIGTQDTLYDDNGRHYFENCYIEGASDFICGDGQSLYKGCTLHGTRSGAFTAQRRSSAGGDTGYSFVGCKLTGSGTLFLGRAWGPYSRVVFSNTYMDDVVKNSGWYNWGDSSRDKTVFYGEYKCSGPGSNRDGRVPWSLQLTDAQAMPFQTLNFIDGASWVQV